MSNSGTQRIVIDITTPVGWSARHFFRIGRRRVAGGIIAISPRVLAFGIEVLNGYGKGAALMLGPLWVGFAIAPIRLRESEA
ncbi:hypothetical protein [Sphingomonas paucimobilis]|uniref:hypothetical protein n=1 Tax=Sphingomonas paucimobilis TaxID=13689 RepID=UPI00064B9643|nr:hypothetical protein [Sphingomonas paucimobilis]